MAVGVTVYVTVPIVLPEAVSDCSILLPEPADAPETPFWETVHAKVVPDTLLVRSIELAVPEQIKSLAGVAVTFGVGFTVTVKIIGGPGQPEVLAIAVTVAVRGVFPVLMAINP